VQKLEIKILYCTNIFFLFTTLLIFYIAGIDAFPDYHGYLVIANNKALGSGGFVTEFLSQYVLNSLLFGESPETRVYFFYFLFQTLIVLIFLTSIFLFKENIQGLTLLNSLYLPFFLTTGIRTALLCYIYIFLNCLYSRQKISFLSILFFIFCGILIHDSFMIISLILFISYFWSMLGLKANFLYFISFIFLPLILINPLGGIFNNGALFEGIELARFLTYLTADSYSVSKAVYIFIICLFSLLISFYLRLDKFQQVLIYISVLSVSFISIINYILGVRLTIFLLIPVIIFGSRKFFGSPKNDGVFLISLTPLSFIIFISQYILLITQ